MVGRNDPCPCGSGLKYKKCCERVVAFRSAERARESREAEMKLALLSELNQWFDRQMTKKAVAEWANHFNAAMGFPLHQPISSNYVHIFRFWLLFDAPCMDGRRPVDRWREAVSPPPDREKWIEELCRIHLGCYEVTEVGGDEIRVRPLPWGEEVSVRVTEPIEKGVIVIARLSRLGNRYEWFGPYTTFFHEMRGEILLHLKQFADKEKELDRDFWVREGLGVLGWSIRRAKDREEISKIIDSVEEVAPVAENLIPISLPELPEGERQCPESVTRQLQLFYEDVVSPLQRRTQELYGWTLRFFRDYIAIHFGKVFHWRLLTEDVLEHLCGVWYVDRARGTPIGSKIFLNTLKHLFRWLSEQGMASVYSAYRPVYIKLIRALPMALEAKRWIKEHGVRSAETKVPALAGTFMLSLSASGPLLAVDGKWLPINLRGHPPNWTDYRFWVKGVVAVRQWDSFLTSVDGVYPVTKEWNSASEIQMSMEKHS